jgi:hypothetical protein
MFRPLLISLCLTSTALADTWTVDDDGKADFDNIQAAVDAASDGDEIVVMPGTYTSTQDGHVVNMLGKAVWLHSSEGQEVTIIDGEDERRGVACFNGEDNNTHIEGFTIKNGYSVNFTYDEFGSGNENGGGIILVSSSPSFSGCNIKENTSPETIQWQNGIGGGVFCTGTSPHHFSMFTNCIIKDNTAANGAGFACWYANNGPILNNCIIKNNIASYDGGGIQINNSGAIMMNSTVCGNEPNQIDEGLGGVSDEGGNFIGFTCPAYGACCTNNICLESEEEECVQFGGAWLGEGTTCEGNPCPVHCAEDVTGDGVVDVSDLLAIIAVWGACP